MQPPPSNGTKSQRSTVSTVIWVYRTVAIFCGYSSFLQTNTVYIFFVAMLMYHFLEFWWDGGELFLIHHTVVPLYLYLMCRGSRWARYPHMGMCPHTVHWNFSHLFMLLLLFSVVNNHVSQDMFGWWKVSGIGSQHQLHPYLVSK